MSRRDKEDDKEREVGGQERGKEWTGWSHQFQCFTVEETAKSDSCWADSPGTQAERRLKLPRRCFHEWMKVPYEPRLHQKTNTGDTGDGRKTGAKKDGAKTPAEHFCLAIDPCGTPAFCSAHEHRGRIMEAKTGISPRRLY